MAVHPVAAAGFGGDAARYEAGRPGYPVEAVAWLADRLSIAAGTVVADVAAGTGKLTRHLVATDARVIGVEPVPAMADLLATIVPAADVVAATAEHLPFAAASLDAITVAQAFHWFDSQRAWGEFRRVLVPGGGVGLIWNARDRSAGWVDAVWSIMDEVEKKAPWRNHDRPRLQSGEGFGPMESATFWHEIPVTHDIMIDRVASVSHVAVLPDPERTAVLERVAAALPPGDLSVRYRVDAYATRRS